MKIYEIIVEQIISEAPLPPDWDKSEFGPGSTIKSRLQYAKPRSDEVGKGSSRIARTINYQGRPTVLKIAMNKKGLAQNLEEVKILSDPQFAQTNILIPLIDYDKDNPIPTWIQTEFAIEPKSYGQLLKKFGNHTGLSNLVNLARKILLVAHLDKDKQKEFKSLRKREYMNVGNTENQFEIFYHYAKALSELKSKYNVVLDDFNGASNWGIYQDRPVIIDIGLTDYSWEFYRKPRKALPLKGPQ